MAFEQTIKLKNCRYDYTLSPTVKKFTLKDNITDKSGLRLVDIFKSEETHIHQEKFYFLMDSLVERGVFTKSER